MLKREKRKMPTFIKSALEAGDLMNAYKNRPPCQRQPCAPRTDANDGRKGGQNITTLLYSNY